MHVESEMHCLMAMEKRKLSLFSLPSNNGLKKNIITTQLVINTKVYLRVCM